MDAEPGRCRRTDGKKWRCYRDVVPNQKYCERHMHRGCQRSRKHVETSEDDTKANSSAINSDIFASSMNTSNATTTDSRTPAMLSTSLNLTVPCPSISKSVPETLKSSSAPYTGNGNWESKGDNVMTVNNGTSTSSLIRVLADKNNTKYGSNCTDGIGFECSNISTNKIDQSSGGNKKSGDASVVPGFGLSPKSVLQCSTGKNNNSFLYRVLLITNAFFKKYLLSFRIHLVKEWTMPMRLNRAVRVVSHYSFHIMRWQLSVVSLCESILFSLLCPCNTKILKKKKKNYANQK